MEAYLLSCTTFVIVALLGGGFLGYKYGARGKAALDAVKKV
jgi:hypothetical protein